MAYKSVGYVKETAFESQSRQKQILYSEGISNIIEENDRANPNILKRKGIKQCLNVLAGYELWVTSIAVISSDLSDIIEVADKLQQARIFLKSMDKKDEWVQCLIYPQYREFLKGAIEFSNRMAKGDLKKGGTGRPNVDPESLKKALSLYYSKTNTIKEIQDLTGVSKSTLYNYRNLIDKARYLLKNKIIGENDVKSLVVEIHPVVSQEFIFSINYDDENELKEYLDENLNDKLKKRLKQ